MDLPPRTVRLLTDEAYVFLCQESVNARLDAFRAAKAELEGSRTPFGVLARKGSRDAFPQTMRTALNNEAGLRDRLDKITALDECLRRLIRHDLEACLVTASPDYGRLLQARQQFGLWEQLVMQLPDLLRGFARDLRAVRYAVAHAGPAEGRHCVHELAVLRVIAVRLEGLQRDLTKISAKLETLLTAEQKQEINFPPLPDFNRVAWVGRIAILSPAQAGQELTAVEKELRAFLSVGFSEMLIQLKVRADICRQHAAIFLEHYWNQLRVHARLHYVEEQDVDEVLNTLTQRYVIANIEGRQSPVTFVDEL